MSFTATMNAAKIFLRHNKSLILTAAGVVLTIAAVCETVRATSKAKNIIDDVEYEKFEALGCPEDEKIDYHLTKTEVIKSVWKCYILTALLTSGAVTCVICSHVNSNKTISAMSMAYASLLETYNSCKDNIKKNLTQKEQRNITHGMVHDIIEEDKKANPNPSPKLIINSDSAILFRDAYSSKGTGYFKLSMDEARKAVAKFNKWMMDNDQATLNDWYDFLGLGHSELGDYLFWKWENGPLYLRAIPDDIDVDEDNEVVTVLGLTTDESCTFFSCPDLTRP